MHFSLKIWHLLTTIKPTSASITYFFLILWRKFMHSLPLSSCNNFPLLFQGAFAPSFIRYRRTCYTVSQKEREHIDVASFRARLSAIFLHHFVFCHPLRFVQNFTEIVPGEPLRRGRIGGRKTQEGYQNRAMSRSGISSPGECVVLTSVHTKELSRNMRCCLVSTKQLS